ncbi:MAG TPA: DUF4395 family protein [Gammaproteobacteria bacterium]|nr:DUF4395 family protein [Gammaproteobacteria bacterium]
MPLSPMTRSCLTLQGFACDVPAFGPIAPWLRWTPVLSTIFILLGTFLREPYILWAFAVIAFVGAAGWNAFDALFNYGARFFLQLPRLPPNPAPRRFAMVLAAAWATVTGAFFAAGWTRTGLVAGILLLIAAVTVATTQFCIGSLVWRLLYRRPTDVTT